jgi:hypothetical protein
MSETIALVSCGKSKLPHAAPARDLYTGQLFRAARAYVEAQGWPWWILSVRHGLLHPETVITPYDVTLVSMKHEQRRAWAERVLRQIARNVPPGSTVVILAGVAYHEFLLHSLQHKRTVELPLRGMGIGKQIAWLKSRIGGAA